MKYTIPQTNMLMVLAYQNGIFSDYGKQANDKM